MKASELIHNGLYKVGDEVVLFYALNGCLYKPEGDGGLVKFFGKTYEDSKTGKLEVQLVDGVWKEMMPIPLTAEILKANGWEETRHGLYKKSGVPFRIDIGDADLWLDNEWDDYYPAFSLAHIHEFLQALRLCGLHELADNFKIK